MIVWLQYDGVIVLFVNVVNAYKSKKLQRNVKQKIDWKNHKKYCLRLSFLRISSNTRTQKFPEDLWKSKQNGFSRDLVFTSKKDPMAIM